ncbi:DUF707 domain-containing protein [Pedobacter aquatilis]|uniref:DUF707 domain-containing protein n=1 Tax=Pedobacter aquatilis TaxID=351343 RepID=UPI002930EB14|nr:DUF707 domain-containing protein [Pedobacter aquatilis]
MNRLPKKNIVIAPCGNKSYLFNSSWLKDNQNRDFDICLMFYHENIDNPKLYEHVDYFFHLKDFKYLMLHKLLTEIKPEWISEYEYFYFLDDDIEIETLEINRMFNLSKAFNASVSQASLSSDSYCSWPIFKLNNHCFLRYVGQIEVMAPLFDRTTLLLCLPTFTGTLSSWGIDSVWSRLLNYSESKMIVFDDLQMKHTLPVGGGELYKKLGVDPRQEWVEITNKYGAKLQNYVEYGRLKKLHVKKNKVYKISNYLNQLMSTLSRKIRDYDLSSRIRLKLNR